MLSALICAWCLVADATTGGSVALADISIRDPFVLAVPEQGKYYLYGTGPKDLAKRRFNAFVSSDLQTWEGPLPVFQAAEDFWGLKNFWAAECHRYRDKYYLFGSAAREFPIRATQIFESDNPLGPFVPLGDSAQTPRDWQCLDGTLYLDEAQKPWMVFCHEWTQVGDGEICAIRLSEDLRANEGEPILLFHASDASWGKESTFNGRTGRITDGPFLYRTKSGALLLLWSTFSKAGNYCVGLARSGSGALAGPWTHAPEPWYAGDGGHAMLFRTFAGELVLCLHAPNRGTERVRFMRVEQKDDTLHIGAPLF